ncbi:hypothetical protein JCM21900_005721 [Sporobolomyces salmonicolor]
MNYGTVLPYSYIRECPPRRSSRATGGARAAQIVTILHPLLLLLALLFLAVFAALVVNHTTRGPFPSPSVTKSSSEDLGALKARLHGLERRVWELERDSESNRLRKWIEGEEEESRSG